jgi:hypothetical protein
MTLSVARTGPVPLRSGPDAVWLRRFEDRRGRHGGVSAVDASGLGAVGGRRRALGRSLATFQLGESGTGEHLFRAAAQAGVSADHLGALRHFVVEEQEHARLLAAVLDGLGAPRRHRHWTDAVFVRLRRAHTLRSEVLTLLVAEVIALTYYAALRDGLPEGPLTDVFARIRADEEVHVDFHAETLPRYLRRSGPAGLLAARVMWNALVMGAAVVAVVDHAGALAGAGMARRTFVARVWADRAALDRRLFG